MPTTLPRPLAVTYHLCNVILDEQLRNLANTKSCLLFYNTLKTDYCQQARGFINVDKVQSLGKLPDFDISESGIFAHAHV
jgi:hypothetical protein